MLLKLVMPYIDRMIQSGSIFKWCKTEGESVNYGEELLHVKVVHQDHHTMMGLICITSSDMGIIRRIYAQEGAHHRVGDLLAVLGTDANESIDETDLMLTQASAFRVVVNFDEPNTVGQW